MKIDDLKGKKILIVGYGIEGKSVEAFLKKKFPKAIIAITDQNDGPYYLDKQSEYDLAIRSPGVKKNLITIPHTTATNIFFANINSLVIGVTGTKGKSTTASLINHILLESGRKSHLVGNIGVPALEALLMPIHNDDIFVIELSSYQLDDICYSPHIVVITSLFPEHMNYHGNVDLYYGAKKNILTKLSSSDIVVYNSKYSLIDKWVQSVRSKKIDVNSVVLGSLQTQLIGKHNNENILLAYSVAKELHLSDLQIMSALASFAPLSHRLEKIGSFKDIVFYDDAISTIPESTIAALECLKTVDTLFLGGQDRGYDFTQLIGTLLKSKVSNLVLFPDSGEKIYNTLKERGINKLNILRTDSMKDAVKFAFQYTKKGRICLLSTASPSYNLWKNYIAKGNVFKKCIQDYEKN